MVNMLTSHSRLYDFVTIKERHYSSKHRLHFSCLKIMTEPTKSLMYKDTGPAVIWGLAPSKDSNQTEHSDSAQSDQSLLHGLNR